MEKQLKKSKQGTSPEDNEISQALNKYNSSRSVKNMECSGNIYS